MPRLKVFISSVMEPAFSADREFASIVADGLGFQSTVFEKDSKTGAPSDESVGLVAESDLFLQLLWIHHSEIVGREYDVAVEHGKPVGVLIKSPVGDEQRTPGLESHIARIKARHSYKTYRTLRELQTQERNLIQSCLQQLIKRTVHPLPSSTLHLSARDLLGRADSVASFALTPVLVVGPKPYLAQHKSIDEETAYNLQRELLDAAGRGDRQFVLAFSGRALVEEARRHGRVFASQVQRSIERLDSAKGTGLRFGCSHPADRSTPRFTYLAADASSIVLIRPRDASAHYVYTEHHQQLATSLSLLAEEIINEDGGEHLTAVRQMLHQLASAS